MISNYKHADSIRRQIHKWSQDDSLSFADFLSNISFVMSSQPKLFVEKFTTNCNNIYKGIVRKNPNIEFTTP